MNLVDARCLVTGASSGIGRATALALTRSGSLVALAGRDGRALGELATICHHLRRAEFPASEHLEESLLVMDGDLTMADAPEALAGRVFEAMGRLDVVICNAGAGWVGSMSTMSRTDVDYLIDLNLRAPIHLLRSVLPQMIDRGRGHIVLVASVAGQLGLAEEAVYSATKAGMIALGEALRSELSPSGIGVSVVSPGLVDTAFFQRRNRPYERRWPRPISGERVAAAVVDCVQTDRSEAIVPRWMSGPIRLHGGLPTLYRTLEKRFGPS